ncbi:hypothetical protein EVG20_g2985 [Dentipellis fragilis]|uniref:Phosphatidylinositol 4-kinase n=1 Tax=Dentipellis fragilis TaxID=205917 RepID=A0A4Y9Z7L2_9AGAM|nr:hypothetical protein EVG20_g2985 [Dentipellis fragilis]
MPSRSEYQPIPSQADDEGSEADVGEELPQPVTSPSIPSRSGRSRGIRRLNHPGHIDLRKLDNAFKRWTESIAQKMKRKKKAEEVYTKKEIWRSVFDPPVAATGAAPALIKTLDHKPPMTQADFDALVQGVKRAISEGIHPKMITKGSSGSYFARAKVDGRVQTVAVFKPKDEEPYGRLNPKAFFYDWIDRTAFKKGKPLPEKIGSMQYFLHGFQVFFLDASDFLRKHPWPGRSIADTFDDSTHRTGNVTKRLLSALKVVCGRTGAEEDVYDEADAEDERVLYDASESSDSSRPFYWSQTLQQSFREELEKLVILDYLMLNTDRGADNYMIKHCEGEHEKSFIDVAPSRTAQLEMPVMTELRRNDSASGSSSPSISFTSTPRVNRVNSNSSSPYTRQPHIHIAAIDNSLSFPHEHPHGWRSYTYGWLYLPVSVIGRPFSEKTRNHFLPLLTSRAWWEETTFQLRKLFAVDPDFHPKMFERQLAVIKGQAWNIVQSLKHDDEGPLELTRRSKALVWDDEMELAEETIAELVHGPLSASASPKPSVSTLPMPISQHRKRSRSQSGVDFPPPARRSSTDMTGVARPVPFSAKFQRVHPGTTGVTVLEHMERLDAVEASLDRLALDSDIEEEEEEEDVVDSSSRAPSVTSASTSVGVGAGATAPSDGAPPVERPAPVVAKASGSQLPAVPENASSSSSTLEEEEDDVVELSKSMSHLDAARSPLSAPHHGRWTSQSSRDNTPRGLDWMQEEPAKKRVVVAEVSVHSAIGRRAGTDDWA